MAKHRKQSVLRYPLSEMLGSVAHIRTLRELYEHGGELSAPTIMRRTGLAKASVASALQALEHLSVVRRAGQGRSILYTADMSHPLAAPLAELFAAEKERFEAILNQLKNTAERHHALAAWLYGSAARGEDALSSDVDVAIVMTASADTDVQANIRNRIIQIGDELCFLPSTTILDEDDVVRLYSEGDPWWIGVAEDAYVLTGDRPEQLAASLKKAKSPYRKRRK